MSLYVIGVDFGTLSGRAVLVDSQNGSILAQRVMAYPHKVMTEAGDGWALHDPDDYLLVLESIIPPLIDETGINAEQIAAIGWDVTACTMLPALKDSTPLSSLEAYSENPHAYAKLWKHLSAEKQAQKIEKAITEYDPTLLSDYGGRVASQWMLPKILQTAEQAPEVFDGAELFLEVSDWLTLTLTGNLVRSSCFAGFKNFFDAKRGYLPTELLKRIDPRLENTEQKQLKGRILPPWAAAGRLKPEWAKRLKLSTDTVVSAGIIDAHAGLPGSGTASEGQMLISVGTSACHMLLSKEKKPVPGICGVVGDSVYPDLYAYEAGQACVGDMLDWFVNQAMPMRAYEEAMALGMGAHEYLSAMAAKLSPGSGGLIALDWWNGQRTPYVDDRLSGLILGMTLKTTPAQQYRAMMEAAAYGTRMIIDNFESNGVPIHEVIACGGISVKNPLMMQIYADVIKRPVHIAGREQTAALGAAVMAAVAAGIYPSPVRAAKAMALPADKVYYPRRENSDIYDGLYREYCALAEYFAKQNTVMHRLKMI